MSLIYHITTRPEWEAAQQSAQYESASLKEEGFIHCSEERQVAGVLQRFFSGKHDLVKLVIETTALNSPLIYDWSDALEDTFPHIYGPINISAVIKVLPIEA